MQTTQPLDLEFKGVYLKDGHWVAIYRTPLGNFKHHRLWNDEVPTTADKATAESYARENTPAW